MAESNANRKKLLTALLVALVVMIWGRFFFQLSQGMNPEESTLLSIPLPAQAAPARPAPRATPVNTAFTYRPDFRDPFLPEANLLISAAAPVAETPTEEAPPPEPQAPTPPPLVLKGVFDETAMLATPSGDLVFAKAGATVHETILLKITATEVETRYGGHRFTLTLKP